MPYRIPEVASMEPTPGLLLVQVPPPPSMSVIPTPWQTSKIPVMIDGNGFTVTAISDGQPATV